MRLVTAVLPAMLAGGLALSAGQSRAQAPAEAPPSTTVPGDAVKPDGTKVPPGTPLSKKLDESEGVITPPHGIDPEIKKDTPAVTGDKMPVIIPPGEPGGDQSVQPK